MVCLASERINGLLLVLGKDFCSKERLIHGVPSAQGLNVLSPDQYGRQPSTCSVLITLCSYLSTQALYVQLPFRKSPDVNCIYIHCIGENECL